MIPKPVPLLVTLILASIPATVFSETPGEFQLRAIDTAAKAGKAALPVACGGLFRALSLASKEGSNARRQFAGLEADAASFAIFVDMKVNDTGQQAAIQKISKQVQRVSAVYLNWFTWNLENEGGPLTEPVEKTFRECRGLLEGWQDAMEKN